MTKNPRHSPLRTLAARVRLALALLALVILAPLPSSELGALGELAGERAALATPNGPQPSVGLYWFWNSDPTAGPGVVAPLYQLLVRIDVPSVYWKSGAAATAWTKVGAGAGGGAGTVTSVTCLSGLACTPNPIVGAGTIGPNLPGGTCPGGQFGNALSSGGTLTCGTPAGGITGTGTANTTTKWTGASAIGNGWALDDGTTWGVSGAFTITEGTGAFVASAAGSIGGALTMNSHPINAVTDPSLAQDAATKHYVDTTTTPSGAISGTTNTLAKFTSAGAVGNSLLTDNATQLSYNSGVWTVAVSTGNAVATGTLTATSTLVGLAGASIAGALTMNSHLINSVTDPVSAQDAATKHYVDSTAIPGAISGTTNTMAKFTGTNTIGNSLTTDNGTTWAYNALFSITASSGAFVASSTGSIGGALNMNSHLIDNVTDPAGAQDAATKNYVDTHAVPISPTTTAIYFSDFINGAATNATYYDGIYNIQFSGTGAQCAPLADEQNHPGISRCTTGTTTTGRGSMITGGTGSLTFLFGTGAFVADILVRPGTLCDSVTDICTLACGFIDSNSTIDSTDGAYFKFNPAVSANWRIVTINNGTDTATDIDTSGPVAPSNGTWQHLGISVNSAGTSVAFTVNGVAEGTLASNIPTGAGRNFGAGCMILKSAGTNGRVLDVDYANVTLTGLSR